MRHQDLDKASLAMAQLIAEGLPDHPEWLELARTNLSRWSARNADAPSLLRCYEEWSRLLDLPVHRIQALLVEESDEGQRLRQNSPFAGVLPPAKVWEIKRRIRDESSAA